MPIVQKFVIEHPDRELWRIIIKNIKEGPGRLKIILLKIIVSSCGRATGTRNALVRESSSIEEAFATVSSFLSLFSHLSPLYRSSASSSFSLAHNAVACATNSQWVEISSRGFLSIEPVFRPRRFAIVRNVRGCYSQVRTGAPT